MNQPRRKVTEERMPRQRRHNQTREMGERGMAPQAARRRRISRRRSPLRGQCNPPPSLRPLSPPRRSRSTNIAGAPSIEASSCADSNGSQGGRTFTLGMYVGSAQHVVGSFPVTTRPILISGGTYGDARHPNGASAIDQSYTMVEKVDKGSYQTVQTGPKQVLDHYECSCGATK